MNLSYVESHESNPQNIDPNLELELTKKQDEMYIGTPNYKWSQFLPTRLILIFILKYRIISRGFFRWDKSVRGSIKDHFFFSKEKSSAEQYAHQVGLSNVTMQGLPIPTHKTAHDNPSKIIFDIAFKKAYKDSFQSRFKPFDLFWVFYRVVVTELISRFEFSDNIFELIQMVHPINARNLKPKSLRMVFQRFSILKTECDVAKADF